MFHPARHAFAQIIRPGAIPVANDPIVETPEPIFAAPVVVEEEEVIHPATCDFCDETIRGVRHKCKLPSLCLPPPSLTRSAGLNCPDTDACPTCYNSISTLHPLHNFLPLPSPISLRLQPGDRAVHPHIACDACSTFPIIGVRYKCSHVDCPDFDMCAACEADPIPRHARSHHLLKIREPATTASKAQAVQEAIARARTVPQAPTAMQGGNKDEVDAFEKLIKTLKAGTSVGTGMETTTMRERGVGGDLPPWAQMVDGPGGDRTVVVDVDVGGACKEVRRLRPAVMHFPIGGSRDEEEGYDVEVLVAAAEKLEEEDEERGMKGAFDDGDVHPEEMVREEGYDVDVLVAEAEEEVEEEVEEVEEAEVLSRSELQAKELDAIFVCDVSSSFVFAERRGC